MTTTQHTPREFTLTWTIDASPETVFLSWTDPDRLGWYYNDGQPTPTEAIELDLRVGGVWRQLMVIDEDTSYFTGGIYREIVPNERLVYAWGATGGWPRLDPDNLDESPQVTDRPDRERRSGPRWSSTCELPAELPDDGVPAWWPMVENGFRDTIDRLAAALGRTPARCVTSSSSRRLASRRDHVRLASSRTVLAELLGERPPEPDDGRCVLFFAPVARRA